MPDSGARYAEMALSELIAGKGPKGPPMPSAGARRRGP